MPDVIPPGYDYFETDPWTTYFEFRDEFALPAGFFDAGSDPLSARVRFRGVPLESFGDVATGTSDTVVRRLAAAQLPPPYPSRATIPIEIVALSMTSTDPIAVRVGGATQLWDVHVALSEVHAPGYTGSVKTGSRMTLTKSDTSGGTFDSELTVIPRFDFVRLGDRTTRTLDVGLLLEPGGLFEGIRDQVITSIRLTGNALTWTHDPPTGGDVPVGDPGQAFFSCSTLPQFERGPFGQHGVNCGKKPPTAGESTGKHGCCDVCCSVQAEGHCGCVDLGNARPEQLVFVASQPGVANSPLGRGQVLAYITVSNDGPAALEVFWDGPPPAYAQPNQSAILLPGNSITCVVDRALKLRFSAAVSSATSAHGCYVVSWCCPEFTGPRAATPRKSLRKRP